MEQTGFQLFLGFLDRLSFLTEYRTNHSDDEFIDSFCPRILNFRTRLMRAFSEIERLPCAPLVVGLPSVWLK